MGFFDTIDRLKSEEPGHRPPEILADQTTRNSQNTEKKPVEHADFTKEKIIFRRETLLFLNPCPLCGGRDMLYNKNGAFFCLGCQPEATGTPVKAGGPDRQEADPEAGLHECDTKNFPGFSAPAGSRNIAEIEQGHGYFLTAWIWIKENMPELLAAGWTRAALLQRSKYRHPLKWGIAWFSVWHQKGLVVTIGQKGKIIFSLQEQGRTITQTASPPIKGHRS